jgi:DNA-binding transcriptional ArsR family regulator
MDEIRLSSTEFRALSSETRTGIIKLLSGRNHTLSELSKKLALAAPTVKQHLSVLEEAGLIQCIDEGRKWKYYSLTKKGRGILQPEAPSNLFIVLGLSIIGMAVALYALLGRLAVPLAVTQREDALTAGTFNEIAREAVPAAADKAQAMAGAGDLPALVFIAAIFAALSVIFLSKALRKK